MGHKNEKKIFQNVAQQHRHKDIVLPKACLDSSTLSPSEESTT